MPHRPLAPLALLLACLPALAPAADDGLGLYFREDRLVESATRAPKPLSQVAENVTVVTAAEIEAMNARTLAEVLNRVTGVFVRLMGGSHSGAIGLPHIQGSGSVGGPAGERHSAVLLDGVPWNSLAGNPALNTIPVGIIDRIEVIRGPASSAWGSALGGVINVITKGVGTSPRPTGVASGSFGERRAWDARVEVAAAPGGPVGYYLQGQAQHADWAEAGAGYEAGSLYGRAEVPLGPGVSLTVAAGSSRPEHDGGHAASQYAFGRDEYRDRFARVGLDARTGASVSLHINAFLRDYRLDQKSQEDGTFAPVGDLLQDSRFEEEAQGFQARAVWTLPGHTVVAGVDYVSGTHDQTVESGEYYRDFLGWPAHLEVLSSVDRVGAYVNDTAVFGPLAITAGLRHDRASSGGSFTSPSLGAAWRLSGNTVARAAVARGFALPGITEVSGGGHTLQPNPDLDPEQVFSWQAGVESDAIPGVWLKAMVFRHESTDSIEIVPAADPSFVTPANRGRVWRTGGEVEAETATWFGLSARVGFAFARIEMGGGREHDQHQANVALAYRAGTVAATLFGHYVWWDLGAGSNEGGNNDMLWDLMASKSFATPGNTRTELFATVRNLFNGDLSPDVDRGTEPRWFETGVRVRF